MDALLDPLQYAILPIFAFPALGFVMGLRGTFERRAAEGANGYVVSVALPCMMFYLLARADLGAIDWPVMYLYVGSNLALYAAGFAITRFGFGRTRREAVLVGMTGAFPNHVFFALPIVETLYGVEATLPVTTMIVFDIVILFAGTVLIMESLTGGAGPLKTLGNIARNRLLIAIAAGVAFNIAGLGLHEGVARFLALAAGTAAPVSLFALGVILSDSDLKRIDGPALSATVLKVAVHPLIAIALLGTVIPVSPAWAPASALVFAAPCGAMAFVLGLRYGAPVDSVAKAIILSTILSVFTVALLA